MSGLDDLTRPVFAAQETRQQIQRCRRGAQTDANVLRWQSFERNGQMRAALVLRDRVQFIDDDETARIVVVSFFFIYLDCFFNL